MKNIKSGDLLFALIFFMISAFLMSQLPDQVKWFKNTKLTSQPALWCSIGLIGMTAFGLIHLLLKIRLNDLSRELKEGLIWIRSIEFACMVPFVCRTSPIYWLFISHVHHCVLLVISRWLSKKNYAIIFRSYGSFYSSGF
jgi:hypothetical protein